MLTQEQCETLEKKMLERINKQYAGKEDSIPASISKIAARVTIMTLQEYEKIDAKNQ